MTPSSQSDSQDIQVWTYYGDSTDMLEQMVQDLINRGGKVLNLAIGYGPSPARVAGLGTAPEATWHAMVIADVSRIDPNL